MNESAYLITGALLYLVFLMGVGYYASRNIRTSADFIVAGRRLPLMLCVFTVFATWFGSGTLIGAAGAAYSKGIPGVLANPIGSAICLALSGVFYVRILRRMRLLTVPDLFRLRFGKWAEVLSAVCIIPAYVGWVASIFVAFGYVIHTIAGIDTTTAIVISAAITLIYTFAGGMWAVALTDFIQALIIIIGLVILYPLVMGDVGGLSGLLEIAPEGHFTFFPDNNFKDWLWFLQALLVIGIGNVASQDLMQRAFGSRDEKVAQWSMYISTFLYITIAMLPVLFGVAGTIIMPDIADPEFILPSLGMKYLHPAAMAIFTGSADGGVLAPASIFSQNILKVFKRKLTENQLLWSIRWSILTVGLLSLLTALYFQNVYKLMVKSFSILFVGLIIPMTAALYWKKCNGPAAVASIVSGMVSWLVLEGVLTDYPADMVAAVIGLVVLVVATLATAKMSPALPLTDVDGRELEYKNRLGTLGFPLRSNDS